MKFKVWLDPFVIALFVVLLFGLLIPFSPTALQALGVTGNVAVATLFFLYGARLPTGEVFAGLKHWRLQVAILAATFVLFPVLGLATQALATPLLGAAMALGLLYVCLLPSTVQSSVAMVSIARGNVAGAICGATVSNLVGMLATPALVMWLMYDDVVRAGNAGGAEGTATTIGMERAGVIVGLLLVPFVVGQLLQRWLGAWVRAHRPLTLTVDRGTILLVVLSAVASAKAAGTFTGVGAGTIAALVLVCGLVLAIVLVATWWGGKAIGLARADRIALLHCGSTKSLATGIPMATVLLPTAMLGAVVVPVVVFHQLELMVCAVLARRQARGAASSNGNSVDLNPE